LSKQLTNVLRPTQIAYDVGDSSNRTHVFCGDQSNVPKVLSIYATEVNLTFRSDDDINKKGFKLFYTIFTRIGERFYLAEYVV